MARSKIGKWFTKRIVKKFLKGILHKNKKTVVRMINARVNLPKLNERQEEQLIEAIFDVVLNMIDQI